MIKNVVVLDSNTDWTRLQKAVHNAVVQIFAQVAKFNWIEPYKVEDEVESRGSGFLINEDGYIATNAHVVDEAKRVWIHIPALGRQIVSVEIVGFCPERDLALLRIVPSQLEAIRSQLGTLPFLECGDSDTVQRTDPILVLGYPLGRYQLKATTGVVSGYEASNGRALLQITAPVNIGSSGGPLLNHEGKVIGITVATIMDAHNISYAIAINDLKHILELLYTQRLVRLPHLGTQFLYANDSKALYLHNPMPAGLYIAKVIKGSLFEKIGIQPGDMIYEFNGYRIDAYGETQASWIDDKVALTDIMARIHIGEKVSLVLYRNGQRKEVTFSFNLMPPYPIRSLYPDYESIEFETLAGMVIMPLANNHFPLLLDTAPDLIKYAQLDYIATSVLIITHIVPGSLAHQAKSLMAGDRIEEVNEVKVPTLAALQKAIAKSSKSGFLTFKTERGIFAAFSLQELVDAEQQTTKSFVYPLSKSMVQLIKKHSNGDRKG